MKGVTDMLQKIGLKTVLSITGAALSIASTVISGVASQKAMKEEVAKEVAKALRNK